MRNIEFPTYRTYFGLSLAQEQINTETIWYWSSGTVKKTEGHFNTWTACRDLLQSMTTKHKIRDFIFWGNQSHDNLANSNLVRGLNWLQDKLSLKSEYRLVISDTDRKDAIHIAMTEWWDEMRLSFLSAFLRAVDMWNGIKPLTEELLLESQYFIMTKYATSRFLNGYTKFKWDVPVRGWILNFEGQSEHDINKLLTGGA